MTTGVIVPRKTLGTIKFKFAALVIGATLASCVSVGALSYVLGSSGLIEASKFGLQSIVDAQQKEISGFDRRVTQTLGELSSNSAIAEALDTVPNTLSIEGKEIRAAFQPEGATREARVATTGANTKLLYGIQHAKIHPTIASAWKNSQVSEIYMIGLDGVVYYTVTKGPEFLTSMKDQSNAPLQPFFDKAAQGPLDAVYKSGFVKNADGSTSAYYIRPLAVDVWGTTKLKGVVAIRVDAPALGALVAPRDRDENVTDSFLLAADGILRAGDVTPATGGKVPETLVKAAQDGATGAGFGQTEKGEIFYAYKPVDVDGQPHLMVVGKPKSVILASADRLAFLAFLCTLGVLAVMGTIGILVSARLTGPLVMLAQLMNRLNGGEKAISVGFTDRGDEIGTMARALESFRQNALEKDRVETEIAERDRRAERERGEREMEKARSTEELQATVSALASALRALSQGQLETRIDRPFVAALDQLRLDFNESVARLEETISAIGASADTIQAGAANLKNASGDLAHRTERQAASLEEAAAALGEMTDTINATRTRCETADTVASSALDQTLVSGAVVKDAISAMERIEQSSQQIRSIIEVIDQIAFQTNLLALNAGVEAARAGEAGKGFAVVAQEVRELAQKTAAAARDINGLIGTSAQDVGNGVALVLKTGTSLAAIEESVQAIHEHIGHIVSATRDQSTRLQEINGSVNDLDHVTQQNAAMVEETTAAAFGLDQEAVSLIEQISAFSTSKAPASSARAA